MEIHGHRITYKTAVISIGATIGIVLSVVGFTCGILFWKRRKVSQVANKVSQAI